MFWERSHFKVENMIKTPALADNQQNGFKFSATLLLRNQAFKLFF